jgi:hypothetical protein
MNFEDEFLDQYLRFGLGSMAKTDIDALVMFLLDKYGLPNERRPLEEMSNQFVSEKLKIPVSKVKSLRYAASLKFSDSIEDVAKQRFKRCLLGASFSNDIENLKLLIEDQLAKAWIQGKLKDAGIFHDDSFNKEAISIRTEKFIEVLEVLFSNEEIKSFKDKYYEEVSKDVTERDSKKLLRELKDWSSIATGAISILMQ